MSPWNCEHQRSSRHHRPGKLPHRDIKTIWGLLQHYIARGQELSDWTLLFYVSYVLVASFLIFNLFIGIVINSMEEARAIELHRAERAILDEDDRNDERAHAVVLEERLRSLRTAIDELERELRARPG